MIGEEVPRFPVILFIVFITEVFTEGIVGEFAPISVIDIFTNASVVIVVQNRIHRSTRQNIISVENNPKGNVGIESTQMLAVKRLLSIFATGSLM